MTAKKVTLYKPDDRVDVVSVEPFDYVRLPLTNGSSGAAGNGWENGQPFPQISGYGFMIERCDLPCMITPTKQTGRISNTIVARVGQVFEGKFNGLSLLTMSGATWTIDQPYIDLIIFKTPDAKLVHIESSPYPQLSNGQHISAVNGTGAIGAVFVPPGSRECVKLLMYVEGTTCTGASGFMRGPSGGSGSFAVNGPVNITDLRTGKTYNGINQNQIFSAPPVATPPYFASGGASGFILDFRTPILIPTAVTEFTIQAIGTGHVAASIAFNAVFR